MHFKHLSIYYKILVHVLNSGDWVLSYWTVSCIVCYKFIAKTIRIGFLLVYKQHNLVLFCIYSFNIDEVAVVFYFNCYSRWNYETVRWSKVHVKRPHPRGSGVDTHGLVRTVSTWQGHERVSCRWMRRGWTCSVGHWRATNKWLTRKRNKWDSCRGCVLCPFDCKSGNHLSKINAIQGLLVSTIRYHSKQKSLRADSGSIAIQTAKAVQRSIYQRVCLHSKRLFVCWNCDVRGFGQVYSTVSNAFSSHELTVC